MPPEPPLALDASLAPAQIYIVLAITVASFSWLLKPETLGQLAGLQVFAGFSLVFFQLLHLVFYATIHASRPELNTRIHGVVLLGYVVTAAWLFRTRWMEAKSQPPKNPDDD